MTSLADERPEGAAPGAVPERRGLGPRVAAVVVLLAGLGLLGQAIREAARYGVTVDGPRLAPLIVTAGWVVLAVAYTIQCWTGKEAEAERGGRVSRASWVVPLGLMAALVGYALVLEYTVVGYVPATAVFFVVAARLLSTRPVREVILRDAVVGLGLSLVVYVAFTRFLDIQLPAGVLPI
jgi:putative tricarboxylic transport membrane protein